MPVKPNIYMKALRIAVLFMFATSVAVTVWSMLRHHDMALHYAHVVLITLTFLLIALYLHKSAEMASLMAYRELHNRMKVDPDYDFIEYMPTGAPVFTACAGALARKAIYVKSKNAMVALTKLIDIAITGNSDAREGYGATMEALGDIGVRFSVDTASCPVKILLGEFDVESYSEYDFILTNDKVAYILAAVYICKLYVRFSRLSNAILICAIAAVIALSVIDQFPFAGAAAALWAASELLIVHQIGEKTKSITFKSLSDL